MFNAIRTGADAANDVFRRSSWAQRLTLLTAGVGRCSAPAMTSSNKSKQGRIHTPGFLEVSVGVLQFRTVSQEQF
jgi:hypothetical protein